jgi:hypothetical protein
MHPVIGLSAHRRPLHRPVAVPDLAARSNACLERQHREITLQAYASLIAGRGVMNAAMHAGGQHNDRHPRTVRPSCITRGYCMGSSAAWPERRNGRHPRFRLNVLTQTARKRRIGDDLFELCTILDRRLKPSRRKP